MQNKIDWYALILDLSVEAERLGADLEKEKYERYILPYIKRKKHPRNYNWLRGDKKPYVCPRCHHFHSHNYIIGRKPKRCYKCHFIFDNGEK
jgi:hypothetical protein